MSKQREYWTGLISYIISTNDVANDFMVCDGDAKSSKAVLDERMAHLTSNYILRRKPQRNFLFPTRIKKRP